MAPRKSATHTTTAENRNRGASYTSLHSPLFSLLINTRDLSDERSIVLHTCARLISRSESICSPRRLSTAAALVHARSRLTFDSLSRRERTSERERERRKEARRAVVAPSRQVHDSVLRDDPVKSLSLSLLAVTLTKGLCGRKRERRRESERRRRRRAR